jgi:Spermidine synthase
MSTRADENVPVAARTLPTADGLSPTATLVLACCLFVLSGACGLAYEVVWSKYLGLFLGNTVLLHTAVLGTFMGGLALGSLLIGRRVARINAPLKAYGYLELAIAAYALAFPSLTKLGEALVAAAAAGMGPGTSGLIVVKVLTGVLLLALPTLLMGATLPLLTAHVERSLPLMHSGEDRTRKGGDGANWLYFANCAGAVLGTLVTGFLLIPYLGLAATVTGVAILNALVGLTAAGFGLRSAATPTPTADAAGTAAPRAGLSARERTVLVAICLSGATAFFYELVWTRLFAVSLGSSTYSFTLMLAAFITGLSVGSIAANLLPVRRAPLLWFAGAELAIGVAITLSLILYPRIPYWTWHLRWMFRPVPESIGLYQLCQYGIIFAIMAVPTFLFGLTFPAAIRAAAEGRTATESGSAPPPSEGGVAERAALVYGWNTIGTLVGVVFAGCVLIPLIGLQRTLQAGAALNLLIGAGLLLSDARLPAAGGARRRFTAAAAAVPAVIALGAILATPRWSPLAFTFGSFRMTAAPPATFAQYWETLTEKREVLFYREDFGTTVGILHNKSGSKEIDETFLVVDGKPDASSVGDMPTQKLVGHVPLFLKPDAKDVFVLGLGSGASAGSILTHPGVRRVDCVELSPAVAEAARFFDPYTGAPSQDARFRLTIDDGKSFLQATPPGTYDVIVSEPTNPWIAGVGTLFSEESFREAARALKEDGIVAQWFHTYSLDNRLAATIIRTCRNVFPHVLIFQGAESDYILIASRKPFAIDFGRIEQEFGHPAVRADLAAVNITSPLALLAQNTHTPESIPTLEEGGGINSNDLPILEYFAPDALYTGATATRVRETDERLRPGSNVLAALYMRHRPPTREALRSLMMAQSDSRSGSPRLLRSVAQQYIARWPEELEGYSRMAQAYLRDGDTESALPYLEEAAKRGDADARTVAASIRQQLASTGASALTPPAVTAAAR